MGCKYTGKTEAVAGLFFMGIRYFQGMIPSYSIRKIPSASVVALLAFLPFLQSTAQTILEVGPGKPYPTLPLAAQAALPGDTILLSAGVHPGGMYIPSLQGTANAWITIRGNGLSPVTIQGGTNAIQFTDPAYLVLENIRIREQTGNGLNIDDGGSYDTPAHHVIIRNCVFEDMAVDGNNDLLKLSGLDSFLIEACIFQRGADGGSGIDMVGCHWGAMDGLSFEEMGSNSIQAKGGSRYLTIRRSLFTDGGLRSLNLGGSTGAAFFRPFGANYEAADIDVYANIFIGSQAPIAYVGSQGVRVWNNTIYRPGKWVIRILQESADTSFYQAAAYGEFVNNLVIVDNNLSTTTNVGPNTNAASFFFAHNLWFHLDQPNWSGPSLPSMEINGKVQIDPMLLDPFNGDMHLTESSPAIHTGAVQPEDDWNDFDGVSFHAPASIGAFEWTGTTAIPDVISTPEHSGFGPNPTHDLLHRIGMAVGNAWLLNVRGDVMMRLLPTEHTWTVKHLPAGIYWIIEPRLDGRWTTQKLVIQ